MFRSPIDATVTGRVIVQGTITIGADGAVSAYDFPGTGITAALDEEGSYILTLDEAYKALDSITFSSTQDGLEVGLESENVDDGTTPIITISTSGKGSIWRGPQDFFLATGAPLAVFADGDSAVPGSALVDSEFFCVRWNNKSTHNQVVTSVNLPADADPTKDVLINVYASKVGATEADATKFTIAAFNNLPGALHNADADYGGDTGAMDGDATSKTIQVVTRTLALANLPASGPITLLVKPKDGTLATDDVCLGGLQLVYSKINPAVNPTSGTVIHVQAVLEKGV